MNKTRCYFAVLPLALALPLSAIAQGLLWKTIRPAESTINDVEQVLGNSDRKDHYARYETTEGVYFVSYSTGRCEAEWKDEWNSQLGDLPPLPEGTPLIDWNLPAWTVKKVSFLPNEALSVVKLGIDLRKLKKVKLSSNTSGIDNYVDENAGIRYTIQYELQKRISGRARRVAQVTAIVLTPAAHHSNLRCDKKPLGKVQMPISAHPSPW